MVKSIDKIKIKLKMRDIRAGHKGLQKFYDTYSLLNNQFIVTEYPKNLGMFSYCYRFDIAPNIDGKRGEGVFYVEYCYNGGTSGKLDVSAIQIEFNPNKINPCIYQDFIFYTRAELVEIKSLDYAIDIPVLTSNVFLNVGKCNFMYIGAGSKSITRYLKPKERNGRLKIYDKQLERNKNGISIDTLTRIEVSIAPCPIEVWKPAKADKIRITGKSFEHFQSVCHSLNSIIWFEEPIADPLIRLLMASNDIDRKIYLDSVHRNTRQKIMRSIRHTTECLEYDVVSLFIDILRCLKEIKII